MKPDDPSIWTDEQRTIQALREEVADLRSYRESAEAEAGYLYQERDAWKEAALAMLATVERAAQDGDPTAGKTWHAVRAFLKYRAADSIKSAVKEALRTPALAPAEEPSYDGCAL